MRVNFSPTTQLLEVLPDYAGDREFDDLLRRIRSPLSSVEVRAFLLGVLAVPTEVPMGKVIPHILGHHALLNGAPDIQKLLGNLLGLLNLFMGSPHVDFPYVLPHVPQPNSASLKEKILLRQAEISQFYQGIQVGGRGLEIGGTWHQMTSKFVEKTQLRLKMYLGSLKNQERSKQGMKSLLKSLDQLDNHLSEFVSRLIADAHDVREALFQKAKDRIKDPDLKRPLRLTSPCSCGSGRKFQKCCWERLLH